MTATTAPILRVLTSSASLCSTLFTLACATGAGDSPVLTNANGLGGAAGSTSNTATQGGAPATASGSGAPSTAGTGGTRPNQTTTGAGMGSGGMSGGAMSGGGMGGSPGPNVGISGMSAGGNGPAAGAAGEGRGGDPTVSEGGGGSSVGGSGSGGAPTAAGGAAAGVVEPSEQCGTGNSSPSLNLSNTIVSIPDSYDGTTPVPVVLAFHAAGNPNTQLQGIIGSTFESEYIVLYPKSAGNGWDNNADAGKVDDEFDALDANVCYAKNQVFAVGHSSGAQFIVQRLCAGESRWRAVSPVASSVYCSSWDPIPSLVIHGIGDTERAGNGIGDGDGLKDIVPYRTSNGCMETYTELDVEGCMSGGTQVDPGCREYDGCSVVTRWCQHNDPQYGTSHHGVPCFGARVMKEFFDSFL